MDFGTIPTENVVLVSALLSGYIAYQSRVNSLETYRERERFISFRLQDATFVSDVWGMTVDSIMVVEDSGWIYRIKKFILGGFSGEVALSIRYENASIPGEFWETEAGEAILNGFDFGVEHVQTQEGLEPTLSRFILSSSEEQDIQKFLNGVIEVEKSARGGF